MSTHGQLVRRTWEQHVLFSVMLELTYRCNLDCAFCYNDLGRSGRALSTDQYLALLADLASLRVMHLVLTGGEPLAYPGFFAVGGRARELGFVVRVKSNGHALRGALARRLKEEVDPFVVDVSLHGASALTHDRQTRVAGSFERLLENLAEMVALGLRVKVNTTLTRWNEHEIAGMFDIVDRLGVLYEVNPVVSPRDDGDRSPLELSASIEGRLRFFRLAEERAARRRAVDEARGESGLPVERGMAPAAGHNCGAGSSSLTVDPYGDVLPCVQWRRPVGNLHERSIGDIWRNSQRLAEVRRINQLAGAKAAQLSADGPVSFCMGLSELTTGDPLQLAPSAVELRGLQREHARRSERLPVIA